MKAQINDNSSIVVDNVFSKVSCSQEHLKTIRYNVSYKKQDMPPVEAQHLIKKFFSYKRRFGSESDLSRLWNDTSLSLKLSDYGVTPQSLTSQQLNAVLRQRGTWDGWVCLVNHQGVFPTGLLADVERQLTLRCGVEYLLSDNRGEAPYGDSLQGPPLFGYQQEAVDSFLSHRRGVIDLPPRSGKTRIAIAIAARLGIPTLYVTPGVGLVKQTVEAFRQFLPDRLVVGQAGKPNAKERRALLKALVWVATPKTAITLPNLHARQLLIIDEFHHAAADTWKDVSEACVGAYWRCGLTGTHYRADSKDMEMKGVLGKAVFVRSVDEMVSLGRLVPAKIAMLRMKSSPLYVSGKEAYKVGIAEHEGRNKLIADAANQLSKKGYRVLVLTKWVGHAEAISALIPGSVQVDGRNNEYVDESLRQLASGDIKVVVGTSVIGEGRDVPAADALVYAAGGKSKVKTKQDYFRVLTASPGKDHGIIVDVADTHHPTLLTHSVNRMMLYRQETCFDSVVADEFAGWLEQGKKHVSA